MWLEVNLIEIERIVADVFFFINHNEILLNVPKWVKTGETSMKRADPRWICLQHKPEQNQHLHDCQYIYRLIFSYQNTKSYTWILHPKIPEKTQETNNKRHKQQQTSKVPKVHQSNKSINNTSCIRPTKTNKQSKGLHQLIDRINKPSLLFDHSQCNRSPPCQEHCLLIYTILCQRNSKPSLRTCWKLTSPSWLISESISLTRIHFSHGL